MLTIEEVKTLRLTCKQTKKLADKLITKLTVNLDNFPPSTPSWDLAYSPLLDQILHLNIFTEFTDFANPKLEQKQWKALRCIIECLPRFCHRLESLRISAAIERRSMEDLFLGVNLQFPSLKSLDISPVNKGFITRFKDTLFGMTSLTRLSLPEPRNYQSARPNFLSPEDYRLLETAPFIENLVQLNLVVFDMHQVDDTIVIEPHLLRRATNLKTFSIYAHRGFQVFEDAPVGNLEKLSVFCCVVPDIFCLRWSLLHLHLECSFTSLDAFRSVFISGNLPRLKTLLMNGGGFISDNGLVYSGWTDVLRQVNLPQVESIILVQCLGFTENALFSIGYSSTTLPCLKHYEVYVDRFPGYIEERTPLDSALVKHFCNSPLGASLTSFELTEFIYFSENGLPEFLANAPSMKSLKSLKLKVYQEGILAIADAGKAGAWPSLQKLSLIVEMEGEDEEAEDWPVYCRELFNPSWPGLELDLYVGSYF